MPKPTVNISLPPSTSPTDEPRSVEVVPKLPPPVKLTGIPKKSGARSNGYFPKVKEAREALRAKAVEILEQYVEVVKKASDAGDYEVAAKSLQWLMEHMPEDDGQRMVDVAVDKQAQEKGSTGPSINIGFALGGIPQSGQPALPTVDVKLIEDGVVESNE